MATTLCCNTYLPLHRRVVKQAKHTALKMLHEDTLRVQISPRRPYEELVEVVNMFDFEQNAMALLYYTILIAKLNKKKIH